LSALSSENIFSIIFFLPTLCSNMRSVFVGRNVRQNVLLFGRMFYCSAECSQNVLYFGIILGGGLGCNRGDLGDFRQGNRQRGKKLVRPRLVKIILGVSQEFV